MKSTYFIVGPGKYKSAAATVCVALLMFCFSAIAQDDIERNRQLLACDAIENAEARLACFNKVVESLRAAPASTVRETAEIAAPAPVADPPPAPSTAPSPAIVDTADTAPATQPAAMDTAEPVASTPAVKETPEQIIYEVKAPKPEPQARPAEPVRRAIKQDLSGSARIARVWENLDGRFSVELDNGQVWRETEGTRVGMPDAGAAVKVTRSLFGSYRMKIDGIPRVAWVRPID